MSINPALQSYLDFLVQDRQDHWTDVQKYRTYADGDQTAQLTTDQRELLTGDTGKDPEFALNVCNIILEAKCNRLQVRGLTVTQPTDAATMDDAQRTQAEDLGAMLTKRAWRRWKQSRMDESAKAGQFAASRDGDAYLVVGYETDHATLTINEQYDGTSGLEMVYEDGTPNKPLYAVKRWTVARPVVNNATTGRVRRMNMYFPDRIEKYIARAISEDFAEANWQPYYGDGDTEEAAIEDNYGNTYTAAVAWWTDDGTPTGTPLGIPVFHLRNNARGRAHGRSDIADVVPGLQDAINLASVSLLAATVLSGFKVIWATGFDPAEGKVRLYPAAILYSTSSDAQFGQLAESDLRQLVEVKETLIKDAATITFTPLSFFNLGGQAPAEGSQKQLELGLMAKVENAQTAYGNAYEDAVRMIFKLEKIMQPESIPLALEAIDELEVSCDWEPAAVRNELEERQMAQIDRDLGIPQEVIWRDRLGYSQEEIDAMRTTSEIKRGIVIGQLAASIRQQETDNEAIEQARAMQQVAEIGDNGNG